MPGSDASATLITTRLVFTGHGDEFDRWAERLEAAARTSPGYLGGARLVQPGGLVHFLHHFSDAAALARWTDSAERRALTDEAERFSAARRQSATGAQPRFKLPSEAAAPKWRTWLATWAAVFPLLLALNAGIRALPLKLPQPVQLPVTSLVMTAVLTWFVLPQLRKLLRPWLLCDDDGGLRRDPG